MDTLLVKSTKNMEEPDIWEHCSVVGSCPGSRRCAGGGCRPSSNPSSARVVCQCLSFALFKEVYLSLWGEVNLKALLNNKLWNPEMILNGFQNIFKESLAI